MDETMIIYAAFFLALSASLVALYLWKVNQRFKVELLSSEKFLSQEKESGKRYFDQIEEQKAKILKLEDSLKARKTESHELHLLRENYEKEHEEFEKAKESLRSLENKVEHHKVEAQALLAQVKELDAENSSLKKTNLEDLEGKASTMKKLSHEKKSLEKRFKDSENAYKTQKDHISKIEKDNKEMKIWLLRLKKRVQQSEHLYKTIRGQKDMLEERLENWEKALRLLSIWVLKKESKDLKEDMKLGELVSSALQASHQGTLVDDGEEASALEDNAEKQKAQGGSRV